MTDLTLIEKVEQVRQTFRLLFPTHPDPPTETLVIWSRFELRHVERGLNRAVWKFKTLPTDDILYRYITLCIRICQTAGTVALV